MGVSRTRGLPNYRHRNALFVDEDYDWPILQGLMNLNEVCACFAINALDLDREPTTYVTLRQCHLFQPGSTASRLLRPLYSPSMLEGNTSATPIDWSVEQGGLP